MRDIADRHLAFLHGFEQGALHFRRRTIDFIRQEQVRKNRPAMRAQIVGPLIENLGAQNIAGEQVDGELHPFEFQIDRLRQDRTSNVLASPGTPWSSRCPLVKSETNKRSTTMSWPTTTVAIRSRTRRMNSNVSGAMQTSTPAPGDIGSNFLLNEGNGQDGRLSDQFVK